jgi:hypothetical protein
MAFAKVKPFLIRGFKGVNTGLVPQNINDAEFQKLENWYPYQGVLYRRGGLDRVSGTAYGSALHGLFAYKVGTGTGSWVLVAGSTTEIAKLSGAEMVTIDRETGVVFTTSTRPWSMKQYKDVLYLARPNAGTLRRTQGDSVGTAGITAPSSAATLAEGAAGALSAGDYIGVYTYYNTASGAESNYSPVSNTLTLAADKKINWTGVTASSNGQCNARRLYRTLVGQQGEYFYVDQIGDNVTTTYTGDNVLEEDMGLAAGTKNGTPPGTCLHLEIFQERAWVTDGTDVYYSELGLPESYGVYNYIPVSPDDGHQVSGIKAFNERLLIGKTNAVYYLTGTDEMSFELRTLTDRHGVAAHHSMKTSEGLCFWFGGDNFYMTDGNSVRSIGDVQARTLVEGIPAENYDLVVGGVDARKGLVYFGIPYGTGIDYINRILAYSYQNGNWAVYTYDSNIGAPQYFGDFTDSNGKAILYCPTYAGTGHVYQFDEGSDDYGYDIACALRTKSYGFGEEDTLKFMKEIQLMISTTGEAEDVVANLYVDDESSATDTFTLNTYGGYLWKRINLANNGNLGNYMDLELTYSGNADFKIAGLGFKLVDTGRNVPVLA